MRLLGSWILVCWSFVTILYSCVFFCFVLFLHSEELIPKLSGKAVECCGKGPQMHHSPFSGPRYTFCSSWSIGYLKPQLNFSLGIALSQRELLHSRFCSPHRCSSHPVTSLCECTKAPASCLDLRQFWKGTQLQNFLLDWLKPLFCPVLLLHSFQVLHLREFPVNLLQANLQLRVYFPGNPSKRGSTAGSCSLVGVLHSSTQEHVWVRIIPQSCPPFCSNSLISTFSIEFLLWVEILKFTN